MFGATSGTRGTAGNVLFEDGHTNGFVHYVEWSTPVPVTLRSYRLFAGGDGMREFASFTLKAKSIGSSIFDLTIDKFTPVHPYVFPEGSPLLHSADVNSVTAQQFRAEFVNRAGGSDGPRIIELDGFGEVAALVGFHAERLRFAPSQGLRLNLFFEIGEDSAGRDIVRPKKLDNGPVFPGLTNAVEFVDFTATNHTFRFYRAIVP
ncbi:MAG TPA: hypothetical protein VMZ27_17905 [Candidatus Saccharimonadales bacterium]|nr:hypothetical protein [Candidatus Saccharimonadales bacterium]